MVYRFFLASVLASGISTCGDRELPTGSAMPPTEARARFPAADTSTSPTCKALIRAGNLARIRLMEAPTDSVLRHRAATFDALVPEACS